MTTATKQKEHQLRQALIVADPVKDKLSIACERVKIVGSVRRKRPLVHDIDLVVIPRGQTVKNKRGKVVPMPGHNLWFDIPRIISEQLPDGKIIKSGGDDIITAEVEGIQVDINRASEETWGILTLVKTGSPEFNIALCERAKRLGLKLSPHAGIFKGEELLPSRTEEDVFKLLQLLFIAPEDRDAAVSDIRAGKFNFSW